MKSDFDVLTIGASHMLEWGFPKMAERLSAMGIRYIDDDPLGAVTRERDTLARLLDDVHEAANGGDEGTVNDLPQIVAYLGRSMVEEATKVKALTQERDRLLRVLQCERGDEGGAPDLWRWLGAQWARGDLSATVRRTAGIKHAKSGGVPWQWRVPTGPESWNVACGYTETALDAMEAADEALAESAK